ncbi:sugar transferase [Verrucomicrobiales bacterium]|nr:sugar transferase [Verrucomicrobiales bacterium]MDA7926707.1 sugar transferase [Verrucomicrobiales bacterium]MDB4358918.1 sugar transferase [Verrucomicrobiales bacterium]|tara:strand:+ start:325 stop:879 length:555 start_codon:yes stop_codon:yes gene_type:complete
MKRLFDICVSLIGGILCAPLLLIVVPLIRMGSKGNAMFSQKRVGLNKLEFNCYKLRSMKVGTSQVGTHEVSESAVTGIGKFLRVTKIDEFPQLWNVFVGEMSLVGPRPCLATQIELIEEREKRGVFDVLPGITGLSQIEGIDMSDPVRLATLDAEYIASAGFGLDLKILVWTVLGKGSGDRIAK